MPRSGATTCSRSSTSRCSPTPPAYADVVLPATTAFEIDDVAISYGSYTVQPVAAVIRPWARVVATTRSAWRSPAAGARLGRCAGLPPSSKTPDRAPVGAHSRQFVDTSRRPTVRPRAQLVDPVARRAAYVPIDDARRAAHAHLAGLVEAGQLDVRRVPEPVAGDPAPPRRRRPHVGLQRPGRPCACSTSRAAIDGAARGPRRHAGPGVAVMSKGVWLPRLRRRAAGSTP